MTNVYIHGALGREFGRKFKFSLARAKDVFLALGANKKNFKSRLIELGKSGAHYSIVIDGKMATSDFLLNSNASPKEIHLMPSVYGSAGVVAAIGVVLYAAALYAPEWAVAYLVAIGSAAISFGISNLLQKDQKIDVGSASATSTALNKSFLFSNGENIAEQGNPVPIGYGRLRIGSSVIQSTIKSFPARFDNKASLPIYSEFTELATKRGLGQMSIFDSQQPNQTNA